jgi:pantothenate kinase
MTPADLAGLIRARAAGQDRLIVAIVGAPGAGKSSLAAELAAGLGQGAKVIPMDGFHFDDRVLAARGRLERKGAPDTYDFAGFINLLNRLRGGEDDIAIPVFDRSLEISRAGADIVSLGDRILIVEGNYLLLDEDPWRRLDGLFDLTVAIEVPLDELVRRLQLRWASHGKSPEAARQWIESNDLPNIDRVVTGSRRADLTIA